MHDHGVVVNPLAQHGSDLLVAKHLFEYGTVQADQRQAVGWVFDQLKAPVAGHRVDDVDQQGLRHRIAGECDERVDDLLGVMSGGAGVPQRQRRDPVGVHMLGGALEFGERRDGGPGFPGPLVIHFEQDRLVALHDQRAVRHRPSTSVSSLVATGFTVGEATDTEDLRAVCGITTPSPPSPR